jgi:hypothetical protein
MEDPAMRPVGYSLALWSAALLPGLTATAAPVPAEPLRGTVLAADGSPAAGAVVGAARQTYGLPERRETIADAQGRFALDLAPGTWSVGARRGTQGGEARGQSRRIVIAAGRAPEPVTVRLEERGRLRGRLLAAETGRPVAGGWLAFGGGLVLTAGGDGRFEIGGLSRGFHMVVAGGPGRERQRVLFDSTARAETELEVTLRAGGTVTGRVTDAEGRPIPGAYVGKLITGFEPCAADGRFVYHGAPFDATDRLTAAAPGYAEDEQVVTAPADGPPTELHFRLRPKPAEPTATPAEGGERLRAVTGVIRGPGDKPLANALVRWGPDAIVGIPQTRTGPDGRFRLTPVPDRDGMLSVFARGLVPTFPRVPAGGDQIVELTLPPGRTVAGVVRDDTGAPLTNVWVAPTVPNPGPQPFITAGTLLPEHQTWTGADARFTVAGLPEHVNFTFLRDGLSDLRDQQLSGEENVVTMRHGGAIRGRVVDRDGKPVRTFRVRLNFPQQRGPGDRLPGITVEKVNLGLTFTADDGVFLVSGLSAGGVYRVTVAADGHGEAAEDRVTAAPLNRLPAGNRPTFRLGPPAALWVRAVAAGGTAVAGALVTLVNGDPRLDTTFAWGSDDAYRDTVRARTDDRGRAEFPALSFGGATVLVRAPGYARQRLGWRDGRRELTVELAPEALIAAEVHGPAGEPLAKGYWRLSAATGDQVSGAIHPGDRGRFRITELPAGPWALALYGSDARTVIHHEQGTLKAGETKELTVHAAQP